MLSRDECICDWMVLVIVKKMQPEMQIDDRSSPVRRVHRSIGNPSELQQGGSHSSPLNQYRREEVLFSLSCSSPLFVVSAGNRCATTDL